MYFQYNFNLVINIYLTSSLPAMNFFHVSSEIMRLSETFVFTKMTFIRFPAFMHKFDMIFESMRLGVGFVARVTFIHHFIRFRMYKCICIELSVLSYFIMNCLNVKFQIMSLCIIFATCVTPIFRFLEIIYTCTLYCFLKILLLSLGKQ